MKNFSKNSDTGEVFKNESVPFNYTLEIDKLKREKPGFFNNPERGEKEICLANDYAESGYYENIPMKTKRRGKIAVDRISGEPLPELLGYFPVFVDAKDYLENKEGLIKVLSEMSGMDEVDVHYYTDCDTTNSN